jgi:hypothetical protein
LGYYEGSHVINLDGLVNNDIYQYAASNTLPEYLSSTGINYIMDHANMLTNKWYRLRGGYDDEEFLAALKPQKIFEGREFFSIT